MRDFVRGMKSKSWRKRRDLIPCRMAAGQRKLCYQGCLGWYHYEYCTELVQGVSEYQRHGRDFPGSSLVSLTGVTVWKMRKVIEELERGKQRSAIQNQTLFLELGGEKEEAVAAWAPVSARDAPTHS